MYQIKEQDWKLFRKKLPIWQEAHMDKLNQEYIRLLSGEGNASDKFWELEERIRRDKISVGVVADMRRSQMYSNLISLLLHEIIREEDLDGFSEELTETIKYVARQSRGFAQRI
ncbi:MAG: multidrug transporter [Oscillospiraceae bacterium]|nr:multidrug transporter [Oscillospiraceae bacterium]